MTLADEFEPLLENRIAPVSFVSKNFKQLRKGTNENGNWALKGDQPMQNDKWNQDDK